MDSFTEIRQHLDDCKVPETLVDKIKMIKIFLLNYCKEIDVDEIEAFVNDEICKKFDITKTDIKPILKTACETIKNLKPIPVKSSMDENCFFTMNDMGFIILHPNEIANHIISKLSIISYGGRIYSYKDGIYIDGEPNVDKEITDIIMSSGGTCTTIKKSANDVKYLLLNIDRVEEYPFNRYNNMIPCKNGIVKINFASGEYELIEHSPEYKFNYCLPVNFNPECTCDEIHEKMITKWVSDQEDIDILYQIPAQTLLQAMDSRQPYKKAYIIQGDPHCGKSTYFELLNSFLGIENFAKQSLQDIGNTRFALASLEARIINAYDDLTDVAMSSTGKFKAVTGAYDHEVERKGVQSYQARITAVHVFTCNAPPDFDSRVAKDTAFWERWEYIKFNNAFKIDTTFCENVLNESNMSGFLNKVIEYVIQIRKNNALFIKSTAAEIREKWSLSADPVYEFLVENIERCNQHMYVKKTELHDNIRRWALSFGKDLMKIPGNVQGLTSALDKYEIIPTRITNSDGVQVYCYNVTWGVWGVNTEFKCDRIRTKTEQVKIGM